MRKKLSSVCVLGFMLITLVSFGQKKVKYKDIFALLNNKQYEAAESFLKTYLKENDDNPNAFLYMGIIYQEKSMKDDVLKQTKLCVSHMDSSIHYYTKAYKTITEKEIKRNNEYYQMYNRRDLRTGEFGVKLSDIQFDLEKKMEGLRERIDRVKMVRHFFSIADSLYKKSQATFVKLQNQYPGEKEFFLRADSITLAQLTSLYNRFDSSMKAFDQYKSSVSLLGKIGYNQNITKNEIKSFKNDGVTRADFYHNDIQVWDYKQFAQRAKQAIEKEIMPVRQHLILYDIEINKLKEKLVADSTSVRNDLTKLIDRLLMEQLKKYDDHPLPMDIFSVKIADLEYRSIVLESKRMKDSSNVHNQLDMARKAMKSVNALDSIATKLSNRNVDEDMENYRHFIVSTFNNQTVLKSYIKTIRDYAEREKAVRQIALKRRENSLRWMVIGADSIPLFNELSPVVSKFKPLSIENERFTTGLRYQDSLNVAGYFYSITPTRVPDIKISFPVEKNSFRLSQLKNAKTISYTDPSGQLYFVLLYSEKAAKDNKYPATLAKIYKTDGLAWSNNFNLSFVPTEIAFKSETGEIILKTETTQAVVDKNGKSLK